jgi:antitoxin ParD1/3/4
MATRNINLTDALDRFVAEKVESGAYQNASEVVRAGLRLLKDEEEIRARKIAALDAAIQVGLDDIAAGRVIEVDDVDAFLREIEAEVQAEADETAPAK